MTMKSPAIAAVLLGVAVSLGCAPSRDSPRYSSKEAAHTATALAPAGEAADSWNITLRKTLAGCDGLEIHGDSPHVVTVEGTDQVKGIVDLIQLDPKTSPQDYCCTGNATFTFTRQGTHIATLKFLYGVGFRWPYGPWEGDGVLTRTSSLAVSRWLAERGLPLSLDVLQRDIDRERTRAPE